MKRFSAHRYDALKLQRLERALSRQADLFALGAPCPRILLCQNRPLCFLSDGTAYMVMAFLPGRTLPPERVTEEQMASLGEACGRIHRAFDRLEPRAYREEEAVWRANPPVALLRRHFAARTAEKMDGRAASLSPGGAGATAFARAGSGRAVFRRALRHGARGFHLGQRAVPAQGR